MNNQQEDSNTQQYIQLMVEFDNVKELLKDILQEKRRSNDLLQELVKEHRKD